MRIFFWVVNLTCFFCGCDIFSVQIGTRTLCLLNVFDVALAHGSMCSNGATGLSLEQLIVDMN